jgi:hypothetical protein
MKLRRLIVGAVVLLPVSTVLGAQSRTSFAVDGSINPGIGKGGEFKDDGTASWRVAASLTRSGAGRLGMFAELAADPTSLMTGDKLTCVPSTRGGCAPRFPSFSGASALLGVESGRGKSRFEVRAGIGGGVVSSNHTRVGAVITQADAGLFPLWHAGVVLGWRAAIIPRFRGDRLTVRSAVVGIRLR